MLNSRTLSKTQMLFVSLDEQAAVRVRGGVSLWFVSQNQRKGKMGFPDGFMNSQNGASSRVPRPTS
jgi:hypothetical protein